jgi:hypothetical protein
VEGRTGFTTNLVIERLLCAAAGVTRDADGPEFLDRLTDLVPPPRNHRHRYHGVFAPNQNQVRSGRSSRISAMPLEPPPVSPARGPPVDWGELVQIHDDRDDFQASRDEMPAIDIRSL